MKLEVLLHIGFRKAASTFIRDWFCFHPELYPMKLNQALPDIRDHPKKKIKYFTVSEPFLMPWDKSIIWTTENMKQHQVEHCTNLKKNYPEGKILMITRSPAECISSEYSEYVKNGGISSYDALKNKRDSADYFIAYYDYNFIIDLYRAAFGKEQVIILPMELLVENPAGFIQTIENHLRLEHYDFIYEKRNPSLPSDKLWAMRLISSFVYLCCRMMGKKGVILFERYKKFLSRKSYSNKRLNLLVSFLALFSGRNLHEMEVPHNLIVKMKNNATVVKELPEFEKYISHYC